MDSIIVYLLVYVLVYARCIVYWFMHGVWCIVYPSTVVCSTVFTVYACIAHVILIVYGLYLPVATCVIRVCVELHFDDIPAVET